jgi:hypothetical protein
MTLFVFNVLRLWLQVAAVWELCLYVAVGTSGALALFICGSWY